MVLKIPVDFEIVLLAKIELWGIRFTLLLEKKGGGGGGEGGGKKKKKSKQQFLRHWTSVMMDSNLSQNGEQML